MENTTARILSADYYKRRAQLLRARIYLLVLIPACLALLVGLSLAEGWLVRTLLLTAVTPLEFTITILVCGLFLAVYCMVLARMTLNISYHLEHAGIAQTAITTIFLLCYLFVFFKLPNPQPVLHLASAKLLMVFLFFRFWQSQLLQARLQMRMKVAPRIFMVSWHAFFVCRWVLAACWLLGALGFALALVSTHPVVNMEGWEGITLLGTFYLLFWAFVRNPNAHADY